MFNKMRMTIAVIVCCFFQDAQGGYTPRQLGNYFGKPVSSFQHIVDYSVVEQWLYTTELSKILLAGGNKIDHMLGTRFLDTRFERFIGNVGKASQYELQEAIKDAILLSSYSTNAYSIHKLLDYLIEALEDIIIISNDQLKHDSKYDQKSLRSLKKSLALAAVLITVVAVTNKYCSFDKKANETVSNVEALNAFAGLSLFPVSYKVLKGCYNVLTINPHHYTKHLNEYQKLLTFVQELKIELNRNGAISFKLANKRRAIVEVQDTVLGSYSSLILDLELIDFVAL